MPKLPNFLYGTAWKKDATASLVKMALSKGFRGIDTANQAKHYSESLVGEALAEAFAGGLKRESIFLQTKFTPLNGQDHRLPYDPKARLTDQVKQSFASSLEHLHTDYLDSYLLHGPYFNDGLGDEDWEVWRALEEIHQAGLAKMIGISNVNLDQLTTLTEDSDIKPHVVQNRCYAVRGWDRGVREFCEQHKIIYQGFSLLTANPQVLSHPQVIAIANRLNVPTTSVVFRFAEQVGMLPLTGTTNASHMATDLAVEKFDLTDAEVSHIEKIEG